MKLRVRTRMVRMNITTLLDSISSQLSMVDLMDSALLSSLLFLRLDLEEHLALF